MNKNTHISGSLWDTEIEEQEEEHVYKLNKEAHEEDERALRLFEMSRF